jgi:molecular chaperone HscB
VSDPFSILGVEPRFDVVLPELESRHRELSRALHPDRYVGRPSAERRLALSKAIEVNEALRVLRDPVRRAEALLARRGVLLAEGEEAKPSEDFLMDVLELREELASARASRDFGKVEELAGLVEGRESRVLSALSKAFAALEADPITTPPDAVSAIDERLGELRYYRRFLEEVRAIEDELG